MADPIRDTFFVLEDQMRRRTGRVQQGIAVSAAPPMRVVDKRWTQDGWDSPLEKG